MGTTLKRAFGWGGALVKQQRRCPEVRLSVNRNHAWEEQAKSLVDVLTVSVSPKRASEAYRSFV